MKNLKNKIETLSQRKAAAYLDISKDTLAKYRRAGYFPNTAETLYSYRFTKADLDAFSDRYLVIQGRVNPTLHANQPENEHTT